MTAKVMYCDGHPDKEVTPANGTDFQLDELYALTECQVIECLFLKDGRILVFDEEGKGKHRPVNPAATVLATMHGIADDDYIVGTALVCAGDQIQ